MIDQLLVLSCRRGWENEKDGFGEVTYDLDSLVDLIIWYVKNGCMLKDLYRKRIDDFAVKYIQKQKDRERYDGY